MKKAFLLALLLPLLFACNQELKDENARLKAENEQLISENATIDGLMDGYEESLKIIGANLDSIRSKEESIETVRSGGIESTTGYRENILSDIEAIDGLIAENRQTIEKLNDKISRYSGETGRLKRRVGKFQKLVDELEAEIEVKNQEITTLKEDLAKKNFKIEELNTNLNRVTNLSKAQQEKIAQQTAALNTAYYTVGTYSELKEKKVVSKEGGIIGIGAAKTLAKDFNKEHFVKIDISKTTVIPVNSDKKVKLISEHPSDSYKFNMDGEKVTGLEITDANSFWGGSKYLVVLIK